MIRAFGAVEGVLVSQKDYVHPLGLTHHDELPMQHQTYSSNERSSNLPNRGKHRCTSLLVLKKRRGLLVSKGADESPVSSRSSAEKCLPVAVKIAQQATASYQAILSISSVLSKCKADGTVGLSQLGLVGSFGCTHRGSHAKYHPCHVSCWHRSIRNFHLSARCGNGKLF